MVYSQKISTKFAYQKDYDEKVAHLIQAGMDISPIPSRFEPAGLGAMYNLKYGALPVARVTGGIQEIIEDYAPSDNGQRLWFSVLRIFKRRFLGRDETCASNLPRPASLDEADETRDGSQFFVGHVGAAL